jgi:hypothetical protein
MPGSEDVTDRRWDLGIGILIAAVVLASTWMARSDWFFADDWTFLTRAGPDDLDLLWRPANGHWMGLTAAVFAAVRAVAGLSSYLPFVVPAILAHAGVGWLLWRWQRRDGVRPWVAGGLVAVFLVYGAGGENLFFAVNLGFNLSLVFGLAFALLVEADDRSWGRLGVAAAVALAAVPTSTTGPTLVAVVAVWLAWRRDWAGLLVGAGPALVLYGGWMLWADGGTDLAGGALRDLAVFTGALGVTSVGRLLGVASVAGAVVVLVVVAVLGIGTRRGGAAGRATTWVLAAAGLLFAVATALTRVQFGVSNWQSPRYAYVVAALVLPVLGVALDRISRGPLPLMLAVAAVLPAAMVANGLALRSAHRDQAGLEQHLKSRWAAAAQLLEEGLDPIPVNVDRYWSPNLHTDHLRAMVAAGDLAVPEEPVPDPWRLEAEIELRSVLHGPSPFPTLAPPDLAGAGPDGCIDLAPGESAAIAVDGPTGVEFEFPAPTLARLHGTTDSGRTVGFRRILALRTPSPRAFWVDVEEPMTFATSMDAGGRICPLDTSDIPRFADTTPG